MTRQFTIPDLRGPQTILLPSCIDSRTLFGGNLGYNDPNARRHAVEMGIYLQMVNVFRDIQEDLSRNRVYLPKEELAKFASRNLI